MTNWIKRIFRIRKVVPTAPPILLLPAPDPERWIDQRFFTNLILENIRRRMQQILSEFPTTSKSIYEMAVEVAMLEEVFAKNYDKIHGQGAFPRGGFKFAAKNKPRPFEESL